MSESANPPRNLVTPLLALYPKLASNASAQWVGPPPASETRRLTLVEGGFDAPRGRASPVRNPQRERAPARGSEMSVASKLSDGTESDSNSGLPSAALRLRRGKGGIVVDVPF